MVALLAGSGAGVAARLMPGLGGQLDVRGKVRTVDSVSINREQTLAQLQLVGENAAMQLEWNPNTRLSVLSVGKTQHGLRPNDLTLFDDKGCPVQSFHPLDGSVTRRLCDNAQYIIKEVADGGLVTLWVWSNNHRNLTRTLTAGSYTIAKYINTYNEKGDSVLHQDYENNAATNKMALLSEEKTEYRYDSQGNWIWQKLRMTTYENPAQPDTITVERERKITYWESK